MDLELKFQRLDYFETVVDTTLYQEETAESIVPDSCPDISRIVSVSGMPCLTERTVQEGRGEVAGQVRAVILYQPEGECCLRRIEVPISFRCSVSSAGINSHARMVAIPKLQALDARVLNPRKVLVRANLSICVQVYAPTSQELCCDVANKEQYNLEQLSEQQITYFTVSVQEKSFAFSDELPIGNNRSGAEELIDQRVEFRCTESKIIGNKLIFKGDADLHLVYRTGTVVEGTDFKLPFSQIMEVSELGEETDCTLELQLAAMECSLGGDGGNLVYVNFEVLAMAVIKEQRELMILRDLYSTAMKAEVEYASCQLNQRLGQESDHQNLRELIEVERTVKTILDTRVEVGTVSRSREGGQLVFTAPVALNLLYMDEEDLVYSVQHQVSAVSRFECPEDGQCTVQCITEGDVFSTPASGGAEVRLALVFQGQTTQRKSIVVVKSAALKDLEASGEGAEGVRPSIVLRQMEGDESLWDVAKSCCTTRAVILEANNLENESDCRGRMLLIPRVR